MITHDSGKPAGEGERRGSGWGAEKKTPASSTGAGWANGSFKLQPDLIEKRVVPPSERINHKVLLVGQDAAPRSIIMESLGRMGYSTIEAEGFPAAMKRTQSEKPDVIVLDVEMVAEYPAKIGWLKASWPNTKIIVLDGGYGKDVPDRAQALKAAGADVVLDETAHGDLENAVEGLMPVSFSGKEPQARQTNGKTVLIMTEDDFLTESFVRFVESFGYDTITAVSYDEVVEKAAGADLILMERGEQHECVEALALIKMKNPTAKVMVRSQDLDETGSPKLAAFDKVLPAVIPLEILQAALAEHLPLADAPRKKPGQDDTDILIEAPPKVAKTHITVLVVDDEPQITDTLKTMLEEVYGHTAITVANGKKGLEAYRRAWEAGTPFHVVISDRQMPELDGAGMITEIKKINPEVKFIFLTGGANASNMARLQELNPVAILEKPVSIKMLGEALDLALSS